MNISLAQHVEKWAGCTNCVIGSYAHDHVFYRGKMPCDVLFIGEAPGKTEDAIGKPFVGKSGKMLEYWISQAKVALIFGTRFSYAITNLTACRPTERRGGPNRAPSMQEVSNCRPRLAEFVEIAKPKAIVLVGRQAENRFEVLPGIPVGTIAHPAYVLRNGETPERPGRLCRQEAGKLAKFIHNAMEKLEVTFVGDM